MSQSGNFLHDLMLAFRRWRVWSYLAVNDLKVRYARSRFGFAWIFISFAVWAAGVGFLYGRLFEIELREFVPFLTIGFAAWGFITGTMVDCGGALISAAGYVKQFNQPKQIYVWRSFATQVMSFSLSLLVCGAVLAIFGRLSIAGVACALPGLALLVAAGAGHAFLFSYLTPFFRDLPYALSSALNVVFFVTPIIFTPALLAKRGLDSFYLFNPFYYLIEVVRAPLMTGVLPHWMTLAGAAAYVLVLGVVAFGVVCKALDRRIVYAL
ncbi:MAG: ABC transporter permease [Betaproteobacteria bacterium]